MFKYFLYNANNRITKLFPTQMVDKIKINLTYKYFGTRVKHPYQPNLPNINKYNENSDYKKLKLNNKPKIISNIESWNIYKLKVPKSIKQEYFMNKEILFSNRTNQLDPQAYDMLVNILDHYLKTSLKWQESDINQLLEEAFIKEIINYLSKIKEWNYLSYKSVLKILHIAIPNKLDPINKEVGNKIYYLGVDLIKYYNFEQFLKDLQSGQELIQLLTRVYNVYTIKQKGFKNVSYVSPKESNSDNKFMESFKDSFKEKFEILYFLLVLINNYKNENINNNLIIQKITTNDLITCLWLIGKLSTYQIDLYMELTEEILKRFKYFTNKQLIIILWTSAKLGLYNQILIEKCLEKLNNEKIELFEKELGKLYLENLLFFFATQEKTNLNNYKNLWEILEKFFLPKIQQNKQNNKSKNEVSTYDTIDLLKFYIKNNDKIKSENLLKKLNDESNHIRYELFSNILTIYLENNFNKLLDQNLTFELFYKIFTRIINSVNKFQFEDFILLCVKLIILENCSFGTEISSRLSKEKINLKSVYKLLTSEVILEKIFYDFYLTVEYIQNLDFIHRINEETYIELEKIAEIELNFILEKEKDKDKEIDNDNYKDNNMQDKNYLFNILLFINCLEININEDIKSNIIKILQNNTDNSILAHELNSNLKFNIYNFLAHKESFPIIKLRNKPPLMNNYIVQYDHIKDLFIKRFKQFKTAVFIEKDKIISDSFKFDIYIPSAKIAFIIDFKLGLIHNEKLGIKFTNYEEKFNHNLLYNEFINFMQNHHGIKLFIIPEEIIFNESDSQLNLIFNKIFK